MISSALTSKSSKKSYFFQDVEKNNISLKKTLNIMMIDDSRRDIELVEEILMTECSFRFHFLSYTNPIKAIQSLESSKDLPDVIILDLSMPIVNGKMVLQRLKEIASVRNVPVVIHSSSHNYENVMKVIELGSHAFFEKPLNGKLFEQFLMG